MNMILTERQIDKLSTTIKERLLNVLYKVEDETDYKIKKVSNTIDYLQDEIDKDLCYEIYTDIYLDSFYGTHEEPDEPVCFEEFYNNDWKDKDCRDWFLSIYNKHYKVID